MEFIVKRLLRCICLLTVLVLLLGAVACDVKRVETETSETVMATDTYIETVTETETPTDTESEEASTASSETVTETESETVTETESETVTETESETVTETESETETVTETEAPTEAETEHVHDWSEASCKDPKTCNDCGVTEGAALGHTGGEATCMGRAVCERCNKVYGNIGNHIYTGEVIAPEYLSKPATLTAPAKYYYSCITCGKRGTKRFDYGESTVGILENNYNVYFEEGKDGDGYLFFTDPHPVNCDFNAAFWSGREERFEDLAKIYGYSKAKFAVCGGDWFNNSNSKDSALAMLKYIREMTTKLFGDCKLVVGNHDYNYQFVSNGTNGKSEYWLTAEELASAWYPDNNGKTYYSFKSDTTRYYVFDSGIDWGRTSGSLTDYDKEQIAWYLGELMANDDKHIVLMPHMVQYAGDNYNGGTLKYAEISTAYNNRETYTYNGVLYDFSGKTGMVEYIIAGHNHDDRVGMIAGIPYILTYTNQQGDPATADFVYADYEARKLYLHRVGVGESRVIDLLPIAE